MLHHIALVGKQLIIILAWNYQILALPVGPMDEVIAGGKGVECLVGTARLKGGEIEHDIHIAHALNVRIAGDGAVRLMREYGIAFIALPLLQVLGEGDAHAFALQARFGVTASGIVEHHEGCAQGFRLIPIHRALVLRQGFPPLHLLVVDAEDGLVLRFPGVRRAQFLVCPGKPDVQGGFHGFIASALASQVSHPVLALVGLQLISASPFHIGKGRESATLVAVPIAVTIRQYTPQGVPLQQIVALGYPRFIAAPVTSVLTVIHHVGHVPLVALTENGGTVYLVVIVLGSHHHAVFIGGLDFLVYLLHTLLRHFRLLRTHGSPYQESHCCYGYCFDIHHLIIIFQLLTLPLS